MLKRIIPFIATFAIGLIIASFFVNVIPSFKFKRSGHRSRHELRKENERLRIENERLKAESEIIREVVPMRVEEMPNVELPVQPIPPAARTRAR
jgi:hypothetical protein